MAKVILQGYGTGQRLILQGYRSIPVGPGTVRGGALLLGSLRGGLSRVGSATAGPSGAGSVVGGASQEEL